MRRRWLRSLQQASRNRVPMLQRLRLRLLLDGDCMSDDLSNKIRAVLKEADMTHMEALVILLVAYDSLMLILTGIEGCEKFDSQLDEGQKKAITLAAILHARTNDNKTYFIKRVKD